MPIAFFSFAIAGLGLVTMVGLKASVFKDRHVHVWVRIRKWSDSFIHAGLTKAKDGSQKLTYQGLLKMASLVYHGLIPVVEYLYRKIASLVYKIHRKLWGFLERSKHSKTHVSEYLKHLSDHKNGGGSEGKSGEIVEK